jgi:hypothetical protein
MQVDEYRNAVANGLVGNEERERSCAELLAMVVS